MAIRARKGDKIVLTTACPGGAQVGYYIGGIPDRLSVEPSSPYYDLTLARLVAVIFNDVIQTRVVEFCISEGWVRRHSRTGNSKRARMGLVSAAQGKIPAAFKTSGEVVVHLNNENAAQPSGEDRMVGQTGHLDA